MSTVHIRRAVGIVSSALLAVMLIGPGTTNAATPTVKVGSTAAVMDLFPNGCFDPTPETGGSLDCSGASPSVVSIGDTVRFQTTIKNADSSTISQLYLKGVTDASIYTYGTPTVVYAVALTKNGSTVNNACAASADLSCSVRNVKPTDVVQVSVTYLVPRYAGTTSDPYQGQPSCELGFAQGFGATAGTYNTPGTTAYPNNIPGPALCVHFIWSTTGATPSDGGGTSHGDVWSWYDGAQISGDLTNYRGRYVHENGQLKVFNDQSINGTNKQSTLAYAPGIGIPVTVRDGPGAVGSCNAVTVDCSSLTFWGEWSLVAVNNGQEIAPDTLYKFLIQFDASEIPNGVNANNVEIYHFWDGGDELITAKCTIAKNTGLPTNASCLSVKKLSGGDLAVTIWTLHNGGFKGGL